LPRRGHRGGNGQRTARRRVLKALQNVSDKVLVIACGAIARELVRIRDLNGWDHLEFQCLPARLHNTPREIPAAVEAKIKAGKPRFRKMFVAYADCGTGGRLDQVLREHGVERIPGAHCYEFFAAEDSFQRLAEEDPGTFYLTDFLVQHFERLVIEGLGIDHNPQLTPLYFGNYRRLVYLAQSESESLEMKARSHAARLGLEFVYEYHGDEPLSLLLRPGLDKAARVGGVLKEQTRESKA
jgi:hypothetical protein